MSDAKVLIECDCYSLDHIARLSVYDDSPEECYLTLHLHSSRPWYRRLACAFKYLFKRPFRYGHWDEMIVNRKTAAELRDVLNFFLRAHIDKVHSQR